MAISKFFVEQLNTVRLCIAVCDLRAGDNTLASPRQRRFWRMSSNSPRSVPSIS